MRWPKIRTIAKIVGILFGGALVFVFGVYAYSKLEDSRRLARLRICIDVQLPDFQKTFHEVGLTLGDAEIWIDSSSGEEYATYPILGDGPGKSKRFYRIHSGDRLCRAGLIDGGG